MPTMYLRAAVVLLRTNPRGSHFDVMPSRRRHTGNGGAYTMPPHTSGPMVHSGARSNKLVGNKYTLTVIFESIGLMWAPRVAVVIGFTTGIAASIFAILDAHIDITNTVVLEKTVSFLFPMLGFMLASRIDAANTLYGQILDLVSGVMGQLHFLQVMVEDDNRFITSNCVDTLGEWGDAVVSQIMKPEPSLAHLGHDTKMRAFVESVRLAYADTNEPATDSMTPSIAEIAKGIAQIGTKKANPVAKEYHDVVLLFILAFGAVFIPSGLWHSARWFGLLVGAMITLFMVLILLTAEQMSNPFHSVAKNADVFMTYNEHARRLRSWANRVRTNTTHTHPV